MLFIRLRLAPPNAAPGVDACANVTPSTDVSTEYLPVDALSPSPHPPDGLICTSEMSTACGSSTVTKRGSTSAWSAGFTSTASVLHADPCDWSNTAEGPHPNAVKSTPLKST